MNILPTIIVTETDVRPIMSNVCFLVDQILTCVLPGSYRENVIVLNEKYLLRFKERFQNDTYL